MFYFIGRFGFPTASRRSLVITTLLITLTLEFGQLWNTPTLNWLRHQPVIGFILGNRFIWSDVVCCLVGTFFALLLDSLFVTRQQQNAVSP